MQNNLNAPGSGVNARFLPSRPAPELMMQYGQITAELLEMGDFNSFRASLLNVLQGYLYACFNGERGGIYNEAADVIELVLFFDQIQEAGQEFVNDNLAQP